MSYATQLFTTKYRCGNAYIACGSKSYLAFGILDNGERVEIPVLIELDASIPEIQRIFMKGKTLTERLREGMGKVSGAPFRVPISFH